MLSSSIRVDDDLEAVYELAYEKGWTDGLPIIPPTPARVERMLSGINGDPEQVVGIVPPMMGEATLEKIAINAVMAGCRPDYMPVIATALEALLDPDFALLSIQATTNPTTPILVINGPIRKELDINSGLGCIGPGWRANATIGRAIRLILLNLGGGKPGLTDRASFGQPAKYSFCMGENEEESPWEPLHVEKGFKKEDNVVTVASPEGIVNISEHYARSPENVLKMIANSMTAVGSHSYFASRPDQCVVLMGLERALKVAPAMSKAQAKQVLWEKATRPLEDFTIELQQILPERGRVINGRVPVVASPEGVVIVVGGGTGPQSVFLPLFANMVTRQITWKGSSSK